MLGPSMEYLLVEGDNVRHAARSTNHFSRTHIAIASLPTVSGTVLNTFLNPCMVDFRDMLKIQQSSGPWSREPLSLDIAMNLLPDYDIRSLIGNHSLDLQVKPPASSDIY